MPNEVVVFMGLLRGPIPELDRKARPDSTGGVGVPGEQGFRGATSFSEKFFIQTVASLEAGLKKFLSPGKVHSFPPAKKNLR